METRELYGDEYIFSDRNNNKGYTGYTGYRGNSVWNSNYN
jgi:hypothetical protein